MRSFIGPIASADRWLVCYERRPSARLRVFCFPYAGGGAQAFRQWSELLPKEVEVVAIQLPGREERRTERAYTRVAPIVDALVPVLLPHLDRPFAFFGHSMGALIAFETARLLSGIGSIAPSLLVASGHLAPHTPFIDQTVYDRPDDEFIARLRSMKGTPEELLENPELLDFYLPVLRSDFEVNETYQFRPGEKLSCPIAAFGGTTDDEVEPSGLGLWAEHTSRTFTAQLFSGGHFFIHTHRAEVLQSLSVLLKRALLRAQLSQTRPPAAVDTTTRR